ncbi:RDD family protein [Actinoallomurus bryophytorum]|uniref:RDD family protein n=1 Tax=Actinoallomurus bryophytorum TaxID=1490222 RepID=UPI00163AE21D|nr:RDD family protein [Actinoallomurus bryophytorum]
MSQPTGVILRRYAHCVIDRLLLVVALLIFLVLSLIVVALVPRGTGRTVTAYGIAGLVLALLIAGSWAMEVWIPHRWLGGTPGMRWVGLRVVTEHGETPALRAYMIRWLMMVVDGYLFGLVGALAIAFTPRHQRFGDMVARTLVVRR